MQSPAGWSTLSLIVMTITLVLIFLFGIDVTSN